MEKDFGFLSDYEKRNVQVYFLVSACVDTVMHYLKGNMTSSIDTVGEVITEIVEKLKVLDVNTLTPIEAMGVLYELTKSAKEI